MPADIYEIIALGARWWFLLLGALIVLRAFGWLRRDAKRTKRRLCQLPDAGMVGEMVVVSGNDDLEEGLIMSVPREGTLGCFRSCDIVIPADGVAPQHCDFAFVNGKGLMIYPRRRCWVTVDGEEFVRRRKAKKFPMTHGSRLQIGEAVLRLRLFEGLETQAAVHVRDEWRLDVQDTYEATQNAWQQTEYVYHQAAMPWADMPQENGIPQPYPPQGMPVWQQPWQPYPQNGFEQNGYPQSPYPQYMNQPNGYQPNGYQPNGYQPNGCPPQWQQPVQGEPPVMQAYPMEAEQPAFAVEEERPHARERRSRRRRYDEET